ncbi:RabGAP/TBC [Astrocystis sublimbata]|nr:RabGAP/TBC [Astrocystis sublimbata]
MALVGHPDDMPVNPLGRHPSGRADDHIADSDSGVVLTSGDGPDTRSPTLPPPSPAYSFSSHPAPRHDWGGHSYDQRYNQAPHSPATPTYATNNQSRDPRARAAYLRDSPTPSRRIPSPSSSLRWDSAVPMNQGAAYNPTSAPSSPVAVSFTNESSHSANESHRSIDSVASETQNAFPVLPTAPTVKTNTAHSPMPVENFSRPRVASIKRAHPDSPQLRTPSQPHDSSLHDPMNPHVGPWPRSRGPSISSMKSTSTFGSVPVRPSHDSHRDVLRVGPRQPHPPPARPPVSYGRAEGNGLGFVRDPIPRMASLPNDQLRSSYRSQLTDSTAQGTLTTERSSVLTKSSSVTSVYGNVDDSLSVDDVLGLYDKGFDDDSGPDDDDEPDEMYVAVGVPEMSNGGATELDIMTEVAATIPEPPFVFASDGPLVRDSAAIFHMSNHKQTPSENTTRGDELLDKPGPEPKQPNSTPDFVPSPPSRHDTNLTTTKEDERDRYGFKKANQYITCEQYDRWDKEYSPYLARRRKKWTAFLKDNDLMTDSPNRFPQHSAKAKRFVRKGIPPDWRGAAWFYYAGGPAIVAKHAGLYDDLLDRQVKEVDAEAIERDLHRTFPDNIRFRSAANHSEPEQDDVSMRNSQQTVIGSARDSAIPGESAMISSLRRVLHAFAIYNPRIGYCQSLNFLAGLLLLFVETEENAFWLLNIITRVYLPGTHEMSLEGANVDLGVLMSSIRDTMPHVWAKIGGELDGTDVRVELTTRLPPITLCMTAWFMSCFIGTLPIESTLRVWDVFFYEGSKTLFRIALTVFKLGEAEIRKVGDPMEIFQVVQTIPRKLIDANALMEACFKRRNGFGHLSQETIEQKRTERRKHVKAEKEKLAGEPKLLAAETDGGSRKGTLFNRKAT